MTEQPIPREDASLRREKKTGGCEECGCFMLWARFCHCCKRWYCDTCASERDHWPCMDGLCEPGDFDEPPDEA